MIAAMPANLAGQGIQQGQVYPKAAGWAETIDAYTGKSGAGLTDYMDFEAMVSHGGLREQGIVVDVGSASVVRGVYLYNYGRFHGFCLTRSSYVASVKNYGVYAPGLISVRIFDNILYNMHATAPNKEIHGIEVANNDSLVYNNQLFNIGTVSGWGEAIVIGANATGGHEICCCNNTVYNTSDTSYLALSNPDYVFMDNNGSFSDAYGFYGWASNVHGRFNYNISSGTTAGSFGGTGNLVSKPAAAQFKNIGADTEDLHLLQKASCVLRGQDESALFTQDAEGKTITRWNTGALQYTHLSKIAGLAVASCAKRAGLAIASVNKVGTLQA